MILYIIRHGHPDYETDSLTELGWKQAEAVGKRIARAKADRIFTTFLDAARRLLDAAQASRGLANKELQRLTDKINSLINDIKH